MGSQEQHPHTPRRQKKELRSRQEAAAPGGLPQSVPTPRPPRGRGSRRGSFCRPPLPLRTQAAQTGRGRCWGRSGEPSARHSRPKCLAGPRRPAARGGRPPKAEQPRGAGRAGISGGNRGGDGVPGPPRDFLTGGRRITPCPAGACSTHVSPALPDDVAA